MGGIVLRVQHHSMPCVPEGKWHIYALWRSAREFSLASPPGRILALSSYLISWSSLACFPLRFSVSARITTRASRPRPVDNRERWVMGGGGGPFVPRSKDEMVHIPWFVDWALSFTAGVTSAICAAPFILIVDRAVTENSAGKSGLGKALQSGFTEFIMRPHQMFTRLPFWMVAGVYGATYATANSIDVACERQSTSATMHSGVKLFGVTAVNMSAGVAKDAAFARMFGAASGGAAALPVGWASLGLFAFRDLLTIGSAFIVPKLLAESLVAAGTHPDPNPNPNPNPNPHPTLTRHDGRGWRRLLRAAALAHWHAAGAHAHPPARA